MAISCVYCGRRHERADQVRACWQRSTAEAPTPTTPEAPARLPASKSTALTDGPVARRGPPILGRNVVVAPDDTIPDPWHEAGRVVITAADLNEPSQAITALRTAANSRAGVVIEVAADTRAALASTADQRTPRPPHELGPRFTFERELLRHLVWANSAHVVDGELRWELLDHAVGLGARETRDGEPGDIVTPDGTALWLDGGPVRFTPPVDGTAVVHRATIEHGSLIPFGSNDSAADLAPDQLAAVTHDGGAARIIAPAGSGKTRVLTERARHLLTRWQLPAAGVCLVAFNKRAQEEMRARTVDLHGLQVRTLNSIALAIVNGTPPFAAQPVRLRTIDEGEVRRIIGRLVPFPRKRNSDPVAAWIEALSLARLGLRDPVTVEAMYDGDVDGFAEVLPRYRAELARSGTLDFDEQVQQAIELLLRDPEARHVAERACRVLLVDEFQDLTPAHLLLVRLLAGADGAVFGVGDDDQTIYGYNGADPAWLIDFAELFRGAGDHPLQVNYRCPQGIVVAADTLLRHNRRRVPKVIRPAHTAAGGWSCSSTDDPVAATMSVVREALHDGRAPGEIAVLARVNSVLAPVQVALAIEGIAVNGGVGTELLERTSVRSALAWLRLATAPGNDLAPHDLAEALRRPARPLHPNVSKWVGEQSSVSGLRRLAGRLTTEREAERVDAFAADIERLQAAVVAGAATAEVYETLRDSMGLAATVATLDVHRHGMNRASQSDDLIAVAELARLQPDPREFEPWLRAALSRPRSSDGVTVATVHRVKGQEWPIVVVHHADADQFPHRLADDREEERRLFHVALTRASTHATIVADVQPSPFIAELTTEPSTTPTAGVDEPNRRTTLASQPKGQPAARPADLLDGPDAALFEELRTVRRHLAAGKPAYTVVADATLAAIAAARPANLDELARIRGIGPSKLEQYGSALLAAVESATAEP